MTSNRDIRLQVTSVATKLLTAFKQLLLQHKSLRQQQCLQAVTVGSRIC